MENILAPAPTKIQNYNLTGAHLGAGIGSVRVAWFILGQTDICHRGPFFINCDNTI